MEPWTVLLHLLILLAGCLVMGSLADRLRQSALVGFLLAGMIVGPNVLGWVDSTDEVAVIAELGAALLLFSIGLEFSLRRLIAMGPIVFIGGTLQVVLTSALGFAVALTFGFETRPALALGAIVSLSSTACVIRVLTDQTQLDSVFGRTAVGILLLQDLAVVPLVLLVTALGGEGGPMQVAGKFLLKILISGVFFGLLYLLLNHLLPRMLQLRSWSRNRDFPILLAVLLTAGSAWVAHAFGLNPAFGAFLAGLLLAESPFAVQIRADVAPLRALLVTLFFGAIGLYGDPIWTLKNALPVIETVLMILVGKTLVIALLLPRFGLARGQALASGLSLAQVGEFSFVLAGIAWAGGQGLIDTPTFRLIVAATFVTLLVTPYNLRLAPRLGAWLDRRHGARPDAGARPEALDPQGEPVPRILVLGFGPAGQGAARRLRRDLKAVRLEAMDINPANGAAADALGVDFHIGDAAYPETLEHLHLEQVDALVVAVPDPATSRRIIEIARGLAPRLAVIVRGRYNLYCEQLRNAGADMVVDEEDRVGKALSRAVQRTLQGRAEHPD